MSQVVSEQLELTGKYRKYPEYKESGVSWLKEIPAHWKMMRLKQTASIQTGIAKGKDLSGIENKVTVPYLRVANVQDGYLKLDEVSTIEIKPEEYERYRLQVGDVLMNEGGDNDKLGRGAIWRGQVEQCIHQNHVFAVRPKAVEPEWLNWLTQAQYARFHFYRVAKQSTNLASISSTNIGELPMVVPPESERRKIIKFISIEVGKIDRLIERQEQLIKLLKEKRQAVISHAVTKGLNPDVPMKDSGVEWLGEVPEHWSVSRLKYFIERFEQGWSPQCEARLADQHEYGVLKVGCVNGGVFNFQEHKALPSKFEPKLQYLVKEGDLLISRANTRELVGNAAVVDKSYDNLILCDKLYRVQLSYLAPAFVASYLGIKPVRGQIELSASGASQSMQNIGQDSIRELIMPAPPENEVRDIIEFLKRIDEKFSKLINKSLEQIALLKERRTTLISEAVTGKIDVGHWESK